jgi:hypothetical protein
MSWFPFCLKYQLVSSCKAKSTVLHTSDDNLRLKILLLKPFNRPFQFGIASLVRQVTRVDQHVAGRQLGRLIMRI